MVITITDDIFIASKTTATRVTISVMMVILLQHAMVTIQTALLMRSGDVETNPGPGRYPGMLHYGEKY